MMIKKNWRIGLFIIIIFIGFFLRFYKLGQIPPGLTNDETNIGYDAYSILFTGKDQWGQTFPHFSFRGFGDYRPPIYTYLTVPAIAVFDLNAFAVRFPSAVIGFLTILIVYLLGKKIFKNTNIGLASALLLSINPWHIAMSRVGIESNLAVLIVSLAVLLFLNGKDNIVNYYLSFILFGLSFYTYTANIAFSTFLAIALLAVFRKNLRLEKKQLVTGLSILILIMLPSIIFNRSQTVQSRLSQVAFTRDQGIVIEINEKRGACQEIFPMVFCKGSINKFSIFALKLVANYINHFSVDQLFINGTETQFSVLYKRGLFYYFELPLLLFGIYFLIKKRSQNSLLLLSWLMLAPVSDAVTGGGHYSRFFVSIPVWQLIGGFTIVFILSELKKFKKIIIYLTSLLIIFEVVLFIALYFSFFPLYYSKYSHYGYHKLMNQVQSLRADYDEIIISSRVNDTKQYIFYLFFTKYNPIKFQGGTEIQKIYDPDGWIRVARIGNIMFVPLFPSKDWILAQKDRILLIGDPVEFPQTSAEPVFEIEDLEGNVLFKAMKLEQLYSDSFSLPIK